MKKTLLVLIVVFVGLSVKAQSATENNSNYLINVFINNNKDIRIGKDIIEFKNLSKEIKKRVYSQPFKIDSKVTYRIFGDKNLLLGYIIDVENELFKGYNDNSRRERYLLETVDLEIDGPDWFSKVKKLDFKKFKTH